MQGDIKIMNMPLKYELPATMQELLALPGVTEELIFKGYLKQILYHGVYGAIRSTISELLEGTAKDKDGNLVTGPDVGTNKRRFYIKTTKGSKDVEKVDKIVDGKPTKVWAFVETGKELTETQSEEVKSETDAEFFLRHCSENGREVLSFVELGQLAADLTPFDVTRKERVAGEKKANKAHLKIATEIADNGALERVAAQLSLELGVEIDVSGDREEAITTLALAIGENEKREAEVRKNKYKTMGA